MLEKKIVKVETAIILIILYFQCLFDSNFLSIDYTFAKKQYINVSRALCIYAHTFSS